MKNIFLLVIPALIAFSCDETKSDGYVDNGCGLELTLVKWSASQSGDQRADEKLAWTETITLSPDSTFFKRREHDGTTREATGRYIYVTIDGRKFVELTYSQREDFIRNSCSADTEHIEVKSSTLFINGEWAACDGPVLEYKAKALPCDN